MTRTNEHTNLERIIKELKEVLQRDSKRPEGYEDLSSSLRDLIEYEIIPALEQELNYDPTPQYLYDYSGGESPVTMAEIWQQAYNEARLLQN